jgi:ubiquitin C-terminal hydrolase
MPDKAVENLHELRQHLASGFFANSDQQDAQEFLQALVNKVKEELDQVQGKKPFVEDRDIFGDRALEMEVRKFD